MWKSCKYIYIYKYIYGTPLWGSPSKLLFWSLLIFFFFFFCSMIDKPTQITKMTKKIIIKGPYRIIWSDPGRTRAETDNKCFSIPKVLVGWPNFSQKFVITYWSVHSTHIVRIRYFQEIKIPLIFPVSCALSHGARNKGLENWRQIFKFCFCVFIPSLRDKQP